MATFADNGIGSGDGISGNISHPTRQVNFSRELLNGTAGQITTQSTWIGLALDTDRLLALHSALCRAPRNRSLYLRRTCPLPRP